MRKLMITEVSRFIAVVILLIGVVRLPIVSGSYDYCKGWCQPAYFQDLFESTCELGAQPLTCKGECYFETEAVSGGCYEFEEPSGEECEGVGQTAQVPFFASQCDGGHDCDCFVVILEYDDIRITNCATRVCENGLEP